MLFVKKYINNTMDKALQTMINNMPDKTGKSLEEWKKILLTRQFKNLAKLLPI